MTLRVGAFGPAILTLCPAFALALALGGCHGGEGPREAPGVSVAAASDGVPAWELVYDLEVDGNADLWAVSASVAEPRRLTSSPGYDGMARFTPDGERIVFSSERTGDWQLFEIATGGGEARRIRTNDATEYQADPSADGQKLAFLTDLDGPERLVTMDFATGQIYDIRLRVTASHITAWIAGRRVVHEDIRGHQLSLRPEVELCRPLGLASFLTTGAFTRWRWRRLPE